jgi:ABC-type transport system substrate-binding protein
LAKDENGGVKPWLVSSWQWTDDRTALILTLNEGIKFHDGTDFNAYSVKYGLDLLREGWPAQIAAFSSVEVVDEYTVRMNLSTISNEALFELAILLGNCGGVSPTAIQTYGRDYMVTHPVGTGPFEFVSYSKDVGVKFTRFDNYWQEGKPYLDSVEYIYIDDPVTAKASFLAGEADAIGAIEPIDASELSKVGKFNLTTAPSTILSLISDASHSYSPFAKLEVRQAVSYAIDNKAIVDAIGYGYLEPAYQYSYPGQPMYDPNIVGYPYNPEKAKELLAAAGYPDGFDTTITYDTGMGYDTTMVAVQRYLADVGIRAELQPVTGAKKSALQRSGWDGLLIFRPYLAIGYPIQKHLLSGLSERAKNYVSILHVPEIESMIDKSLAETTDAAMAKDLQEVNRLITDEYCIVNPLYVLPAIGATYPYVQDAQLWDPWQEVWTPDKAWIKK